MSEQFPLSRYDVSEQPYVYSLCEERRDWRKHIEKHITLAKEEAMGKDENDSLVSNAKAEADLHAQIIQSENNVKAQIIKSENNVETQVVKSENNIKSAIEALKTWWSNFRPSWI